MMHRLYEWLGAHSMCRAICGAATVAALCSVTAAAHAAAVGDALTRPALISRHAASSVLLGAAQAGPRLVAVGERGIVILSDDGGRQWRQVAVPVSVTLTAVRFTDAQHGIAVGHGGVVLTSVDGGESWTSKLDGKRAAQLAHEAAVASGDTVRIREAQRLLNDGPDKPFLDVFLAGKRAFVVGAYGVAFASEDGGTTWQAWMDRLPNPRGLHLYSVRQQGDNLLIAGEQGLALLSGDAGKTFRVLDLPYKGSLFTAELMGPSEIVLAGLRGSAWHSGDAGASWTQIAMPAPVSITDSTRLKDGSVLLASQDGQLLVLRQGAVTPINSAGRWPLSGLVPLSDGAVLTVGEQGVRLVAITGAPK